MRKHFYFSNPYLKAFALNVVHDVQLIHVHMVAVADDDDDAGDDDDGHGSLDRVIQCDLLMDLNNVICYYWLAHTRHDGCLDCHSPESIVAFHIDSHQIGAETRQLMALQWHLWLAHMMTQSYFHTTMADDNFGLSSPCTRRKHFDSSRIGEDDGADDDDD